MKAMLVNSEIKSLNNREFMFALGLTLCLLQYHKGRRGYKSLGIYVTISWITFS